MTFMICAVVVLALAVYLISRRPDEFKVTRTAVIHAPAEAVFIHVNDLHKWQPWSPWAKMDPDAKSTFSGPETGVGASFSWEGNKTGKGTMTITESRPYEYIGFQLDFLKPMKATNQASFTFVPQGAQTQVTWAMTGTNNFMGKCMGLVMDCEKMVGEQFDTGLRDLNNVAAITS